MAGFPITRMYVEAGLSIVTVASSAMFTAFLAVSRSSLILEPIKGRAVADFHFVSSRSDLSSLIDASTVMISASAASASPFDRYSIVCLTEALSILASDAALDALEEDHDYLTAGGVFPVELLNNFIKTKREECRAMAAIPHPAEFERYYNL